MWFGRACSKILTCIRNQRFKFISDNREKKITSSLGATNFRSRWTSWFWKQIFKEYFALRGMIGICHYMYSTYSAKRKRLRGSLVQWSEHCFRCQGSLARSRDFSFCRWSTYPKPLFELTRTILCSLDMFNSTFYDSPCKWIKKMYAWLQSLVRLPSHTSLPK